MEAKRRDANGEIRRDKEKRKGREGGEGKKEKGRDASPMSLYSYIPTHRPHIDPSSSTR
jgi:hypothetical protein